MSAQRNQQNPQQGGKVGQQQGGGGQKPGQQQQQHPNKKPGVAPEYEEQEGDQGEGRGSEGGAHTVPDPNTRGV